MMNKSYPSWIELAILAYCLWQASELRIAWWATPAIRWGWLAFIVWCLPIIVHQGWALKAQVPKGYSRLLLACAVLATTLGSLGDLNALRHVGLAFALAGQLPLSGAMIVWLPSSLSWMAAFGWFARSFDLVTISIMQLGLAAMGTTAMLTWQWFYLRRTIT